MEYVVEGEDIDPQVLTEPGWLNIRRKIAAAEATAATRTSQAPTAGDQPRKRCQKRHKRKPTPPEDPLPDNDIKVILRPQGGLDLTSVNAATLADVLQDQAKLPRHAADQVRLHYRSNFIVVSTPSEARAQCYLELPSLLWKEATYALANHIPPPSATVVGAIFTVPPEDDANTILESLLDYNQSLRIIDAKRLNGSTIVQVLFQGNVVPYWIRYRAATMRCYPFKRKQEACFACWRPGHRKDVCPHPPTENRCTTCGTLAPQPNHPCTPSCILCGAAHLTGSTGCTNRFKPRRRTTSQAMAEQHLASLKTSSTPPATSALTRTITDTTGQPSYSQVTQGFPSRSPGGPASQVSPQSPPKLSPPSLSNSTHLTRSALDTKHLLREMQTMRETILQLRQENARLAQENHALRQRLNSPTLNSPAAPTQPEAQATLASDSHPPPLKRKAETDQPSQPAASAPTTLELRAEYQELFLSFQNKTTEQITALQQSMHDLHTEVLEWMRTITQQPLITAPPLLAPIDAPLPIDADADQEL